MVKQNKGTQNVSKKKRTCFVKRLYLEHKRMVKPNGKQLVFGTVGAFVGAVVMAVSVSAVDSVFTALLELFLV